MLKIFLISLLLVGLSLQQETTSGVCPFPPVFGQVPSLFNVFLFEDFFSENVEIGGRLAAGLEIFLGNGSAVAIDLPSPICPTSTAYSYGDTGDNATESNWQFSVVAGNWIGWSKGVLGSGNIASENSSLVSPEGITVQNCPSFTVVNDPNIIDFDFWETFLNGLSQNLGNKSDTAVLATAQNGSVFIPVDISTLTSNTVNSNSTDGLETVTFVDIAAADLLQATSIQLGNSTTNATGQSSSGSQTLVFNIRGLDCGFLNDISGIEQLVPFSSKIIWNFIDCTFMRIRGISAIPGSILAPKAVVFANNSEGTMYGQLFARSFNGSMTFNNTKFDGCFLIEGNGTATGIQPSAVICLPNDPKCPVVNPIECQRVLIAEAGLQNQCPRLRSTACLLGCQFPTSSCNALCSNVHGRLCVDFVRAGLFRNVKQCKQLLPLLQTSRATLRAEGFLRECVNTRVFGFAERCLSEEIIVKA